MLPDFTKRYFVAKSISNIFPPGITSTELFWIVTFPVTDTDVESWQDEVTVQSTKVEMHETHSSTIRFPVGIVPEYVAPH